MAFGRFESTPYIRSRVFESLLAFQTQVNDSDTNIRIRPTSLGESEYEKKKKRKYVFYPFHALQLPKLIFGFPVVVFPNREHRKVFFISN
jgi:hypothetical protein